MIGDIKSIIIFKRIFQNLSEISLMKIIIYNKNIQAKLNMSINDYINYYKQTVIEIIPKKEDKKIYFINREGGKKFFHIYFNDSKEEVNRNYIEAHENISKIIVKIDKEINSFFRIFENCSSNESIKFIRFNRTDIVDMSYLFSGCSSLNNLNIELIKTNDVTDMENMFYDCSKLKILNLSHFKTNKVENMFSMFQNCSSLKNLNISNFETDNVTNMSYMFYGCSSLKELNLSHFRTNKLIKMKKMFGECVRLKELNLINFDTTNLKQISNFISGCKSLNKLIVHNNLNFENLDDKEKIYKECIIC